MDSTHLIISACVTCLGSFIIFHMFRERITKKYQRTIEQEAKVSKEHITQLESEKISLQHKHEESVRKLKESKQALQTTIQQAQQQNAELEKTIQQVKSEKAKSEKELHRLQQAESEHKKLLEKITAQKNASHAELEKLQATLSAVQAEKAKWQQEDQTREQTHKKQLHQLEQELQVAHDKLHQLELLQDDFHKQQTRWEQETHQLQEKLSKQQQQLDASAAQLTTQELEVASLRQQLSALDHRYSELLANVDEQTKKASQEQQRAEQLSHTLNDTESRLGALQSQYDGLVQRSTHLEQENQRLEAQLTEYQEAERNCEELQRQGTLLNAQLSSLTSSHAQLLERLESQQRQAELQDALEQVASLKAANTALEHDLASLTASHSHHLASLSSSHQDAIRTWEARFSDAETLINQLSHDVNELKLENEKLKKDQEAHKEAAAERTRLEQQLATLTSTITHLEHESQRALLLETELAEAKTASHQQLISTSTRIQELEEELAALKRTNAHLEEDAHRSTSQLHEEIAHLKQVNASLSSSPPDSHSPHHLLLEDQLRAETEHVRLLEEQLRTLTTSHQRLQQRLESLSTDSHSHTTTDTTTTTTTNNEESTSDTEIDEDESTSDTGASPEERKRDKLLKRAKPLKRLTRRGSSPPPPHSHNDSESEAHTGTHLLDRLQRHGSLVHGDKHHHHNTTSTTTSTTTTDKERARKGSLIHHHVADTGFNPLNLKDKLREVEQQLDVVKQQLYAEQQHTAQSQQQLSAVFRELDALTDQVDHLFPDDSEDKRKLQRLLATFDRFHDYRSFLEQNNMAFEPPRPRPHAINLSAQPKPVLCTSFDPLAASSPALQQQPDSTTNTATTLPDNDPATATADATTTTTTPPPSSSSGELGGEPISKQQADKIARRAQIANEIFHTEENYCSILQKIYDQLIQPLRTAANSEHPIITETDIRAIFSSIEVLRGFHALFLEKLKARVENWDEHQRLGDVFLEICIWLKSYSDYVNNYGTALQALEEAKQIKAFRRFISQPRIKKNVLNGQDLSSLLIAPVQRIPRYVLLLQDLQKITDENHPDYLDLKEALAKIKNIADTVNSAKERHERIQRVSEYASRIQQQIELVAPHRTFIGDALLFRNLGEPQDLSVKDFYVLILCSDVMVQTKPVDHPFPRDQDPLPMLIDARDSLKIRNPALLEEYPCELNFSRTYVLASTEISPVEKQPLGIKLTDKTGTHVMYASTEKERDEWIDLVNETKRTAEHTSKTSGTTPIAEKRKPRLNFFKNK